MAQLQFSWKIDKDAREGSTFTFTIPSELVVYLGSDKFSLYDGNEEVAKGVFNGNVGTFTFTSYANTHSDIKGTAHMSVGWAESTPRIANTTWPLIAAAGV